MPRVQQIDTVNPLYLSGHIPICVAGGVDHRIAAKKAYGRSTDGHAWDVSSWFRLWVRQWPDNPNAERMTELPYLQLDTPFSYSPEDKQRLAKRLGEIYSKQMNSNINRLTVSIRELGEGGVWRCGEKSLRPAALLMCDIRRGRPPEQRAELAGKLIDACKDIVGLKDDNLNLEFTLHAGDEMYHTLYGGLSDDWNPGALDSLGT